ncbi:aldolase [Aaosphaeria arxii CBS 175.79]|uniref:deoxyribose-phosphate aldolase n=1 Tax=Aaosphaeria arxii CBS 175.79 TaxID=1450172 RepID=A0A6A5YAR0_9PLEO|nr:aldolase [Aaosphaeria arxii CBS 175.79]KAF2022326.1 aldolase [Aaosphaeria arxii CBS 175.79]
MASSNPTTTTSPTESETLVRDFLAANPALDAELGNVEIMTDRYTNEEWAKQIAETQKKVAADKSRKYGVPDVTTREGTKDLAETVDHTVLKLDATSKQIDDLCSEARTEGFKSVCVRLNYVSRCVSNLKGSPVVVACVVGFHEGTQDTYEKLREARAAVKAGAAELDVVLNHSLLTKHNPTPKPSNHKRDSTADTITWKNTEANAKPQSGNTPSQGPYSVSSSGGNTPNPEEDEIPDYSAIYRELASIRSLCPSPTVLKLILETSQLNSAQILAASHLAAAANFDFIKTSTGFNGPGAKLEDVQLMVAAAEYLSTKQKSNGGSPVRGRKMQVKASGGVRSLEAATQMLEAGATRLGTSSGLWIMQEARQKAEGLKRPAPATRLYTDDSIGGY